MFDSLYIRYNAFLLTVGVHFNNPKSFVLRMKTCMSSFSFFSLSHTLSCREKQKITKIHLHYFTFGGNISTLSLTIFIKQPKWKIEVEVIIVKMMTPYSHFDHFLLFKPRGVTFG